MRYSVPEGAPAIENLQRQTTKPSRLQNRTGGDLEKKEMRFQAPIESLAGKLQQLYPMIPRRHRTSKRVKENCTDYSNERWRNTEKQSPKRRTLPARTPARNYGSCCLECHPLIPSAYTDTGIAVLFEIMLPIRSAHPQRSF